MNVRENCVLILAATIVVMPGFVNTREQANRLPWQPFSVSTAPQAIEAEEVKIPYRR